MKDNLVVSKEIGSKLQVIADEHSLFNDELIEIDRIMKTAGEKVSQQIFQLKTMFSEFHLRLHAHFREEEHLLYLLMQSLPTSIISPEILESMVHQISNEHTMIRKLIGQIEELLVKEQSETHWLVTSIESFIDFLRAHGRKEHAVIHYLSHILNGQPLSTYSESEARDIAENG